MKKNFIQIIGAIIFLGVANSVFAQKITDVSIYDIQYTTIPGDGTYPSLYEGQNVSTGGIVTGINYSNGRFFISSSSGGAWNGLYVYNNDYNLSIGDSVIINAEVYEYNGITELTNLNSLTVVSSGHTLPPSFPITTNQAFSEEAYESVLVEVNNVAVSQEYDEYDGWMVDDGTGSCYIYSGFLNMANEGAPILQGYPFAKITGILTYFWGNYLLEPRSFADYSSAAGGFIISTQAQTITSNDFELPIQLSFWGEEQEANTYNFTLEFDSDVIQYEGYNLNSTLSQGGTVTVSQPNPASVSVQFTGNFNFLNIQDLLKLNFSVVSSGVSEITFSEFTIDGNTIQYFSTEEINTSNTAEHIGDTITVIQKPILNIPVIVTPREEFEIQCMAAEDVTNWAAYLVHGTKEIDLELASMNYNTDLGRWFIKAITPTPEVYELYDLKVSASGIETDVSKNAVQLISQRKTNYSFIHITDTHLPTHTFYPNPGYLTDSSEMDDLREVIRDINIINPEFVLLTGDLINEGEMEDFENRRVYTKAQRLLSELEVPVFLTAGNHDVGGWEDAPPIQGTARRDWWRFFGWKYLQTPPFAEPYYTQNYSFDYGPIHYVGVEAYDNYDSYMYNIYGETSFTDGQMQWLENNLAESNAEKNIVFYHFDFAGQINLVSMGIDLALWGHTHSNSEDFTPPYNVSTAAVCDNNRSYRIINIEGTTITPTATIYAGNGGSQLNVSFAPSNIGEAEQVTATIQNQQYRAFPDAQIKFIMPKGNYQYTVSNGTIVQIDKSGDHHIVYTSIDLDANSTKTVTLNAVLGIETKLLETKSEVKIHPNPFKGNTCIELMLKEECKVEIDIHNTEGQLVSKLTSKMLDAGKHKITWNGADASGQKIQPGVYFCKIRTGGTQETRKIILL